MLTKFSSFPLRLSKKVVNYEFLFKIQEVGKSFKSAKKGFEKLPIGATFNQMQSNKTTSHQGNLTSNSGEWRSLKLFFFSICHIQNKCYYFYMDYCALK